MDDPTERLTTRAAADIASAIELNEAQARFRQRRGDGAVTVEQLVTLCHEQDETIKQQLIAIESLQAENAALSGRIVAAEQNLAESDKTGRIVGERLLATITETIRKAWPE